MSYVNKGDLVSIDGNLAIATGPCFTKLHYNLEAHEMMRYGLDYGTAINVVPVLFTDTGRTAIVQMSRIRKLSSVSPVATNT